MEIEGSSPSPLTNVLNLRVYMESLVSSINLFHLYLFVSTFLFILFTGNESFQIKSEPQELLFLKLSVAFLHPILIIFFLATLLGIVKLK